MTQRNKGSIDPGTSTPETALPDPATPETASRPEQRPNIKFVGRREFDKAKRKVLYDPQPIETVSFAGRVVKLPPADWQKRNRLFYHIGAVDIVAAFPHLYKIVRTK